MKPKRLADLLILTATAALILGLIWAGAGAMAAAPATAAQPETRPETAPSATVTLDPVTDAYVDSANPTQNYGGATALYVGSQTASVTGRALFRFNLSSLPTNAIVDSASFRVYLASTSSTPATLSVGVYRINGDWAEVGVNWKNQPPVTSINKSNGVGTTKQYYDWDVMGLAQTWVNNPAANFGLELRSETEGTVGWRGFASREAAAASRPQLVIEYHLPSCTDAQEPNDTFSQAFLITPTVEYTGCIPTPSDLDYFRFDVPPNTAIQVELYSLPANYDLHLYAPDQSLLDSSTNAGTTSEMVEYTTGPTGGQFYAKVQSGGEWDFYNPYALKLTLTPVTVWPDLVINDVWREDIQVCYEIENLGQATAFQGHHTSLHIDGMLVVTDSIDVDLAPGATIQRCFAYQWQCTDQQDTLNACADHGNDVAEGSETNNCTEEIWTCDTVPPVITSGPTVVQRGETMVEVCWDTDEASTSLIRYDTHAGKYTSTAQDESLVTHHCITIENLSPSTTYRFQVQSTDASGNRVQSRDQTFQTQPRSDSQAPTLIFTLPSTLTGDTLIGASALDDTGVERVEFWLDGTRMHTDFAGPFEWKCDTRKLPEGSHHFEARAFDLAGNPVTVAQDSIVRNLFDALNSPVHVRVLDPQLDGEVWGSVPIVAEVTHDHGSAIRHLEFKVDDTVVYSFTNEACLEIPMGPFGSRVSPCGRTPLNATAYWDATGQPPESQHQITVSAEDWSGNWGHYSLSVAIVAPSVSVSRDVQRIDNYFQVTLSIHNNGHIDISDLTLSDTNQGFQCLNQCYVDTGGGFGPATPCAVAYQGPGRGTRLEYTHAALAAGSTVRLRYYAVPVLFQPDEEVMPTFGSSFWLFYWAGGQFYRAEEPELWSSSDEYALACATSNYLIMTQPTWLMLLGGGDVMSRIADRDQLLCAMAELAKEKGGVLGYLGGDSWFPESVKELIRPGGAWADQLAPAFSAPHPVDNPAYLLIVGEIEIVASLDDDVTDLDDSHADVIHRSDNYYADTTDRDSRPDLIVGRIIGNTARELLVPIQSSLEVHRGLGYDRTEAVALSGYERRSGDLFMSAIEDAADDLEGQGLDTTVIHWSNWRIAGEPVNATDYDGFAMGDVDGDGDDEYVIADDEDGRIHLIEPAHGELDSFASAFERYDGLAVGDLDDDGVDEIVVGYNHDYVPGTIGRLYVYEPDGTLIDRLGTWWTEWDCLAIGDVLGDARKEIVTISDDDDRVYIYSLGNDDELRPEDDWTADVDFTPYDACAVGNVRADWNKDEIVIIRDNDQLIYIYSADGDRLARLGRDLNDDGTNDTRFTPFDGFALGDVNGDGEDEIVVIVDEEDKMYIVEWKQVDGVWVWSGSQHYTRYFDDRDWFEGIRYTGSDPRHDPRHDGFAIGKTSTYTAAVILRNRDGANSMVYELAASSHDITELANTRLARHSADVSVIAVYGHGSPKGPSPITRGFRRLWGTFEQHPFVFSMSCYTGEYEDLDLNDESFGESLFDREAGAIVAATQRSSTRRNTATMREFFEQDGWDMDNVGPGPRFTRYKHARADDSRGWRFWVKEYNYYGDPKFGPAGMVEAASANLGSNSDVGEFFQKAQASAPPPSSLVVSVPMFTVERVNDLDRVEIPGGDVLLEDYQPETPIFRVPITVPTGYMVQDVQMTSRAGLSTTQGLSLPVYIPMTTSVTSELMTNDPLAVENWPSGMGYFDAEDWYPTQDYAWPVEPNPAGPSTLWLTLYPFFYNRLTTDVRFYQDYAFQIRYTTPTITITLLSVEYPRYEPGEPITVNLELSNGGTPQDVVVETTLRRYGSGELVDGLLLRTLSNWTGVASFTPIWDSTGAVPGEYYVEVTLRDAAGDLLDQATRGLRLGTVAAEITSLSTTPQRFRIGEPLTITLAARNSGTVMLSGSATIRVEDYAGSAVQQWRQDFSDLSPGNTLLFTEVWSTTGLVAGSYTVLGSVRYESIVVSAVATVTGSGAENVYLPMIIKSTQP